MRRLGAICFAFVILAVFSSAASAEPRWVAREVDARDITRTPGCPDASPCYGWDIRTVTLKIWVAHDGRSYLTITLRSFSPQGGFASGVALDSRGGPRADYRAYLNQPRRAEEMPMGPGHSRCGVRVARPESTIRHGSFRRLHDGSVATCRLPLRWVKPTRSIRWRVWTDDLFPQPFPTLDRSPDSGWSG
jgi:hypothetical protein